jgi:hypothetical protein
VAAVSKRTLLQALLAACLTGAIAPGEALAQEGSTLERAIKATYLWKFAPFVEWPKTAFKSPDSPFVICIVGNNTFGQVVDEAVAGQRISSRPIETKQISAVSRNSGCEILFDAGSPEQSIAAALAAVRGSPVLTVTDSGANGGPKGIIKFLIEDNHVRFEINDAAAENGLVISSKLLSLAVAVTPRTERNSGTRVV